eukprot:jgi/Ulvmu1/12722/UM095_0026.1
MFCMLLRDALTRGIVVSALRNCEGSVLYLECWIVSMPKPLIGHSHSSEVSSKPRAAVYSTQFVSMRVNFRKLGFAAPCNRSRREVIRAAAAAGPGNGTVATMDPPATTDGQEHEQPRYLIHEIPQSQWPNGIPAVMGAHLMASGAVAPISTSTGPGEGNVPHVFQYHADETDTNVLEFGDFGSAARGMVQMVTSAAAQAIEEKGAFTVAISGGSMLKALSHFTTAKNVDFSKWWVFFVDERNVSHSSDDSTYKGAKETFLSKVDIPSEQVLELHEGMTAAEAAKNYEGRMLDVPSSVLPRNEEDLPVIDCMLLGTGPDGHIASLFPNSKELGDTSGTWMLPVTNSPKPPAERITMTLPVINATKHAIFLATGSGKSDIVYRTLECQALPGAIPAQMVRPKNGIVSWLLDVDSTTELEISAWDDKKKHPRSEV